MLSGKKLEYIEQEPLHRKEDAMALLYFEQQQ